MYRKNSKNSDTLKNCGGNHPKIGTVLFYHRVIGPKDADGMANSVDLDQTAPLGAESDLGPHCLPRPVCPKASEHINGTSISMLCYLYPLQTLFVVGYTVFTLFICPSLHPSICDTLVFS